MKLLRFSLLYLILAGLGTGSLFLFEETVYFRDRAPLVFPLAEATLRIRNDRLGKGTFGAPRSGRRRHLGIDLLAAAGQPVVAVKSGVARVLDQPGMGLFVKIEHPNGLQTIYGHLSESPLLKTTRVRQGEVIGAVGKSGNASHRAILPHLHFEMRNGKKAINPTPFLQQALAR